MRFLLAAFHIIPQKGARKDLKPAQNTQSEKKPPSIYVCGNKLTVVHAFLMCGICGNYD